MWYNSLFRCLLLSPMHGLISKDLALVTFTGRKSGKLYDTPVNYVRDGNVLTVVSYRGRTWWRNLRGGASAEVLMQGREIKAQGQVVEDDDGVAAGLLEYLQHVPHVAKYMHVSLDGSASPKRDEVAAAARDRVIVKFLLAGEWA